VDPEGVHPLPVPTAAQTTLRLALKQRSRLVVEAVRAKSRIRSWLVLGNPDVCDAFGDDPFTEVGVAFLRRYVDPGRVRELGRDGLRRFFRRHGHRGHSASQVEAVWQACVRAYELFAPLRTAGRLPFDYEVLQVMVCQELERIDHLAQQVDALDQVIARAYAEVDPERVLEREVPGVGLTIAPTIEGLVGDVERFGSVKRFAAFFGLVPRARQTGNPDRGAQPQRLTKGGQGLLKQYMFLAAETARRYDPELAQTYARMLSRSKHHYAAVIAVAHQLVRKIYAVLKLRAEARRAGAEGRPAPAVRWRYLDPDSGCTLTARQARAWVAARHPSAKSKKRAAEAVARTRSMPQAGSSEDATNVLAGAPPATEVAGPAAGGKSGENPVDEPSTGRARNALDPT
jgi:transposase